MQGIVVAAVTGLLDALGAVLAEGEARGLDVESILSEARERITSRQSDVATTTQRVLDILDDE